MITSLAESPEYQLHVKQMELNSLLEVTQAINNNLPEEALYKIYHFILRGNLHINKLLLCIYQNRWEKKAVFGTTSSFDHVHEDLIALDLKEVTSTENEQVPAIFQEFDEIIPVYHRDALLAYVFLSQNQIAYREGIATDTKFIQTLTNLIVVAIENKKLAAKQMEQEALNRELQIAKRVQERLFPKKLPDNPYITVKADYFPHQSVSGDYYDFIALPDEKYFVCIADVSGKGIPAALLMSNFQASLRILIRQTTDLLRIVSELNHTLYEILGGERFITGFFALYDHRAHTLTYINAGHHPPLLINESGDNRWLKTGTTVIGIFDSLPFINYEVVENVSHFLLFGYTDGVVEACNSTEEEYGDERMEEVIKEFSQEKPSYLHQKLIESIHDFCGNTPFRDDVTLLTLKVGNPDK
ncbi:PP2C family protein-serine/threonine phosphatase [Xanthocytophaga agilis]|uniref:PP2C family protein-serine/threonine phosphatase n=1 Tax=Xanthocytophaga agilis TaxID=3048010 RepID=A0AAE3R4W6_9BACT|nr:PP2C family protein-serine/threonine phosphatase [Xanthocytophaga agilis]MDJ1503255.1 PP2C family protein-serine/threonine phosphatase [Xanthocytophaga agilis]